MSGSQQEHDDSPPGDAYRSLSAAAVVSAVLGVASPLAFAAPLLVLIPLTAIATAVVALRAVAARGAAGRPLAVVGLTLGTLCLSAALAERQAYAWRTHAQAAPVAEAWLRLIGDGQLKHAFLLSLTEAKRQSAAAHFASAGRDAGEPDDAAQTEAAAIEAQLAEFGQIPSIARLGQGGPIERARLVARGAITAKGAGVFDLTQVYEVAAARGPALRYAIGLERSERPNGSPFWRVVQLEPANDAP